MDTLLISPSRPGAFEESVNRCAQSHCTSSILGKLSEHPNQRHKSRLLGLSYLFSSAKPGGGSYTNNTMSRYNNSFSDSYGSNLDETILKEDPGFCVRQVRRIIHSIVHFLSMLFRLYMWAPWTWVCTKLGLCGCSAKLLVVLVVLLALIGGSGSDYSNQNTQNAEFFNPTKVTVEGEKIEKKILESENINIEKDLLSRCWSHPEIKLQLQGFIDQTNEVNARVKNLETSQSLMQVEMQKTLQEVKSFKEDIWAFVSQLPKQEDWQLQKDLQLRKRVTQVETAVKFLESSLEDVDKIVNAVAYDRNVLDRRLSEISKQLVEFSSATVSTTIVEQTSTLSSFQNSLGSIKDTMDSKISRVSMTQLEFNNRVTLLENELSRVLTFHSKDLTKEETTITNGSALGILKILSHSPTYGEGSWFNALGRSFVGAEGGTVKTADELLKIVEKPGDCWPMEGDSGFVEFQLTKAFQLSGVSIFHIPESMSPDLKTAPKEFRIKARKKSSNSWTDIGKFEYRLNDTLTQEFNFFQSGLFEILRLEIISNHGSSEYTCIYQFKVFATNNLRD